MFCVYSFILCHYIYFFFFFFNDTATTEIYTLSLHDALPISNFNGTRAVSSVGQSVCLTSRRSSVRAGYRPPLTSLAERQVTRSQRPPSTVRDGRATGSSGLGRRGIDRRTMDSRDVLLRHPACNPRSFAGVARPLFASMHGDVV